MEKQTAKDGEIEMRRSPVFRGCTTIAVTDDEGDSKTINLGLLENVVSAYGVTIDNDPRDSEGASLESVPLWVQLQNTEVFTNSEGQYERLVDLASISLDAGEAGTILVNGLYVGEGTQAVVTLEADAEDEYDLCITIREGL